MEEYTTRQFTITDFIKLHEMYDSLSDESKCYFHPGFLGFRSVNSRWFLSQILLLSSSICFLKETLVRVCPRLVFLPLVVISDRNEVAAFGFVKLRGRLANSYFLAELGIVVNTPYQGKGIGSELLENLLTLAKTERIQEIVLTVLRENSKAIRLYEGCGFKKIGKTVEYWRGRNYYVFIMKKSLNSNLASFRKKENA